MSTRITTLVIIATAALATTGCLSFNNSARIFACDTSEDCAEGFSCEPYAADETTLVCVPQNGSGEEDVTSDTVAEDTTAETFDGDTIDGDTIDGDTIDGDTIDGDTFDNDTFDTNDDTGDVGCSSPLTICESTCVDTDFDNNHCGSCTNPCAAGEFCDFGTCARPPSVLFTSSLLVTGNLLAEATESHGLFPSNGSEAADALCQMLADAAGLGDARAIIATSTENADARITASASSINLPIINIRGDVVATDVTALFTNGPQSSLAFDEYNNAITTDVAVWTGPIDATGNPEETCLDWEEPGAGGGIGDPLSDVSWLGASTNTCDTIARLYCIQVFF